MERTLTLLALVSLLALPGALHAAAPAQGGSPATPAPFGSLAQDHELASIWNDPDFTRRLMGSYGFLSGAEPSLTPEEQQFFNERILKLLQGDDNPKKPVKRDPDKAIPLLESKAKPGTSAQFDYYLGTIYFEKNDPTNAIKHFEAALAKAPDFRRAQKNLAFSLVRAGRYDDAIKPLVRTITLGGGDSKVFGLLGFAYMNQGRYSSAEGAYKQALVFEPENTDFKLGAIRCAVETSNYDHALALLDELLKQYPDRENLWTLQANIYIKKEQSAQAAISLEMLRRLGKASPKSLFLLGDLYLNQEARDLALSTYLEAIEKDGGQDRSSALRPAQIFVSRGAWNEARGLFAKMREPGVSLTGTNELKLLKLESRVAMATGEGEKAMQTLEQIILKDPLDGEALLLAGEFYANKGQSQLAEFRFDTASKLEGFEADAFVKHAQMLVKAQQYTKAADLLRKAQKVKPRPNVQLYLEKVEQLSRSGRS